MLYKRFENNLSIKCANGAWLKDSEGNKILDLLLGNCCHVHGHSNQYIIDNIRNSLEKYVNVGDRYIEDAEILHERMCSALNMKAARFLNSGSESVLFALRLAKAAFDGKRKKILRFTGHYHGWFDKQLTAFTLDPYRNHGMDYLEYEDSIISIEWNNYDELKKIFSNHGNDIYCVICEPILCHAGTIEPINGFLNFIISEAHKYDSIVIFDECITGFRVAFGGAQEYYGVQADIVTVSKSLSAGVPFGATVIGHRVYDMIGNSVPYQASTYDANAISVAAANSSLDLKTVDFYSKLSTISNQFGMKASQIMDKYDIPHVTKIFPGIFNAVITSEPYYSAEDYVSNVDLMSMNLLYRLMVEYGIYCSKGDYIETYPKGSWFPQFFVSSMHEQEELKWFEEIFEKCIVTLRDIRRTHLS